MHRERRLEALRQEKLAADRLLATGEHRRWTREDRGDPDAPLVVVPGSHRALSPVPPRRVQALERHLRDALANLDDPEPAVSSTPPPLTPQVCAVCRGGCCTRGGEHAYLTRALLRRVGRGRSDEAIIGAYLSRVPTQAVERSCIYHGDEGCALPREMRSEVCNTYLCAGLKAFEAAHPQRRGQAFVVAVLERRRMRSQPVGPLD